MRGRRGWRSDETWWHGRRTTYVEKVNIAEQLVLLPQSINIVGAEISRARSTSNCCRDSRGGRGGRRGGRVRHWHCRPSRGRCAAARRRAWIVCAGGGDGGSPTRSRVLNDVARLCVGDWGVGRGRGDDCHPCRVCSRISHYKGVFGRICRRGGEDSLPLGIRGRIVDDSRRLRHALEAAGRG